MLLIFAMNVLIIKSSPMKEKSNTIKISDFFASLLKKKYPDVKIATRDLTTTNIPHLTLDTIIAINNKEERSDEQKALLKLSDELIAELKVANLILVGCPMWNFSVPSSLKAYFDHTARTGMTFKYTEKGPIGLLDGNKRVILITSSGGIYSNQEHSALDAVKQTISTHFGFLGIKDFSSVSVEGASLGPEIVAKSIKKVEDDVTKIVSKL